MRSCEVDPWAASTVVVCRALPRRCAVARPIRILMCGMDGAMPPSYRDGMPSLVTCFWISFAVTLLLVAMTLVAGFRARRRAHLVLALLSVAVLTVTIVLAERMGGLRDFPKDAMRIHLWFAKSAALAVLPVALTGAVLWRRAGWRRIHFTAVALFLLLTVTATGTGIWVYGMSTPK